MHHFVCYACAPLELYGSHLRMIVKKLVLVPSCCEVTWMHTDIESKQVQGGGRGLGGVDKSQTELAEGKVMTGTRALSPQSRVQRILVESLHQTVLLPMPLSK
jgi:hypothetical protein